jgi:hypothetical protein
MTCPPTKLFLLCPSVSLVYSLLGPDSASLSLSERISRKGNCDHVEEIPAVEKVPEYPLPQSTPPSSSTHLHSAPLIKTGAAVASGIEISSLDSVYM